MTELCYDFISKIKKIGIFIEKGDGIIMRITAVAVGTRGDVNPLVELGVEMTRSIF